MAEEKKRALSSKAKKDMKRPAEPTGQRPGHRLEDSQPQALQRVVANPALARPDEILALGRRYGNQAVQCLLTRRQGAGGRLQGGDTGVSSKASEAQVLKYGFEGREDKVVQREILLDGKEADFDGLLGQTDDDRKQVVLMNWHLSETKHDFKKDSGYPDSGKSASEILFEAVDSAARHVKDPPELYTKSNLRFLTQAVGRLPTLYFVRGDLSGRIRQQHRKGPKVESERNKKDYFFSNKDDMGRFHKSARSARKARQKFDVNVEEFGGTLKPTDGFFHLELTYNDDGTIRKLHPSGGKIQTDISGFTDQIITSIYHGAIGRPW